ncbi:MAG: efflux RND transporter periplasmic adaptor subunit [Acetivibrionales bacterium]|jgi:HlyD family secretion protein
MTETSFDANRKRKKLILRMSGIFIVVMLVLTFFSNTINNITLPRVSSQKPTSGALIKEVYGSGVIRAKETVKVYAAQGRLVKEVRIKPGDEVKKGDAAVILDRDEIERQLEEEMLRYEQLKLNLEKLSDMGSNIEYAENNLKAEKENLENMKALLESGAISRDEYKRDENAFLQAEKDLDNERRKQRDIERDIKIQQASMRLAELTIEKLRKELDEGSVLLSPADGFVNELNVTEGSLVNGAVPVFSVDDVSKGFETRIAVEREKAEYLAVGDAVDITVKSLGSGTIEGTIREIAANAQNRGEMKDLVIDVPAGEISAGERCDIYIRKRTASYDILVPNTAIGTDNMNKFVWVLNERKGALGSEFYVRKALVIPGDSDSSKTVIVSGLSRDEQVIVSYSKNLSDGCRVLPED